MELITQKRGEREIFGSTPSWRPLINRSLSLDTGIDRQKLLQSLWERLKGNLSEIGDLFPDIFSKELNRTLKERDLGHGGLVSQPDGREHAPGSSHSSMTIKILSGAQEEQNTKRGEERELKQEQPNDETEVKLENQTQYEIIKKFEAKREEGKIILDKDFEEAYSALIELLAVGFKEAKEKGKTVLEQEEIISQQQNEMVETRE
jgi:hypothetical protein